MIHLKLFAAVLKNRWTVILNFKFLLNFKLVEIESKWNVNLLTKMSRDWNSEKIKRLFNWGASTFRASISWNEIAIIFSAKD